MLQLPGHHVLMHMHPCLLCHDLCCCPPAGFHVTVSKLTPNSFAPIMLFHKAAACPSHHEGYLICCMPVSNWAHSVELLNFQNQTTGIHVHRMEWRISSMTRAKSCMGMRRTWCLDWKGRQHSSRPHPGMTSAPKSLRSLSMNATRRERQILTLARMWPQVSVSAPAPMRVCDTRLLHLTLLRNCPGSA